ncbi:MAG: DUF4340 domain-containing protein [Phycisphaerae bacterium]
MRYTTTLILALVVIAGVVLVAVYYDELTGEGPAEEPDKPTAAKRLIEDIDLDDVTGAILQEKDAEGNLVTRLAVEKTDDDEWRLTEPVTGAADDYTVRQLLRAAVEGRYRDTLDPGAEGQPTLADLALDPPTYRLTLDAVVDAQTRTVTLAVGRKAAIGGGVYVRRDGEDRVVRFEQDDLLTRARQPLEKFRDTNLVDLVRDEVLRVTIRAPGTTLRLDRAEDEEDRWVLAEPLAARADPDAVSELLRTAVGLIAADFVKDGVQDFGAYGLAEPRLTVTLYTAGKKDEDKDEGEETKDEAKDEDEAKQKDGEEDEKKPAEPEPAVRIAFGGWADLEQESVYARLGDSQTVVSVEKQDFTKLDKSLKDLRDRHVVALDADRAEEVAVDLPADLADGDEPVAYRLTKTDGTWHVQTEGGEPMKADAGAVDELLEELEGLKVLYFAEGARADAAEGFKPAGSVRLKVEKKAAEVGFEFGARKDDVPSLVRNLREDWVGRINEKDLEHLGRPWLRMVDKQVMAFDSGRATRLAVRGPDRTAVFEKEDGAWTMTAPVEEKPKAGFVTDRLDDLKDLQAEKVLAATDDFKTWNLADGQLAVTVTLEPDETEAAAGGDADSDAGEAKDEGKDEEADEAKEEAKEEEAADAEPAEQTLVLARHEKAKVVGRREGRGLVYELPLSLMKDLASEPLDAAMIDLFASGVRRVEVTAGDRKAAVVKVDDDWFRTDAEGRPDEEVDKDEVKEIIDAAVDLKAARWAAYQDARPADVGLDAPAVRVALTDKDGKTATVLLAAKDVDAKVAALFEATPLRYAMTEGGERVAIVAGKKVETLLSAADTLAPPEPKAEKAKVEAEKGKE